MSASFTISVVMVLQIVIDATEKSRLVAHSHSCFEQLLCCKLGNPRDLIGVIGMGYAVPCSPASFARLDTLIKALIHLSLISSIRIGATVRPFDAKQNRQMFGMLMRCTPIVEMCSGSKS
jgi:hypothetical protein